MAAERLIVVSILVALACGARAQDEGGLRQDFSELRQEKQGEAAARKEEARPRKEIIPEDTCLSSRWHIKTLSDKDAAIGQAEPRDTTIGELIKLAAPQKRFAPFRHETEKVVWRVRGQITGYEYEEDHDYHIVLADREHPQQTMIVESPDPLCPKTAPSAYAGNFARVRESFHRLFGKPDKMLVFHKIRPPVPVVVTGPAFFDILHHQDGAAPNGIEIHPILSLETAP